MKITPRLYQDQSDLQKMYALLQAGCANPTTNTYYPHPGDLNWWLFNWLDGQNPWQYIYLWDDPPNFVQPELCDSALAVGINNWMEEKSTEIAHQRGQSSLQRTNVAETDQCLREHLCAKGFRPVPEYLLAMNCSLERELLQPTLPEGYALRPINETDAVSRGTAQHAAFQSSTPLQDYLQRYSHFMASPGYPRGCDWAAIAPDGNVAAFCIVWPDAVSRIGQIEPVGTHPDFQRKGLGKAVMLAGMRYI